MFVGNELIAIERVHPTRIASKTAAAHKRANGAIVARDLLVQNAHALRAPHEVRGRCHLVYQALHVRAQFGKQATRFHGLLGQDIATHAADEVQAIRLTRPSQKLGQVHRLFANAEEMLKARIEARVVAYQAQIQQVRMQTFRLERDRANDLGAQRHLDTLRMLDGLGIRDRMGITANTAHAFRQKRNLIVCHARFGAFLHAAMNEEQPIIGIDNIFAVNKQAEVPWLVGCDVQRAHRDDGGLFVARFFQELIAFQIARGRRAIAIVHRVFAKWIKPRRPIVGKHQIATVDNAFGFKPEHILDFALRPYRSRHFRRHGAKRFRVAGNLDTHRKKAAILPFHRQHVIQRVMAIELPLVVADHDGHKTIALVIQVLNDLRGAIGFDRHGCLVGILPLKVLDCARKALLHRLNM